MTDQFAQYTAQVAHCLRVRKDANLDYIGNNNGRSPLAAHTSPLEQQGAADMYNQLVRLLSLRDDAQLRVAYKALSECVVEVELDRLSEMANAIMKFNWNCEKRTCEAFIQFLLCLCSAHRNAVAPVLDMLVKQLKPILVKVPDVQNPSLLVAQVDEATSTLVCSRALETIKQIVILVPTCTHVLQDTLIRSFPHRRLPREVLTGYTLAVLRIASFAVPLRPALIKASVDVLLMLDVEIRSDDVQFSPSIQRRVSNPPEAAPRRIQNSIDDALQFDLDEPASLGAAVAVAAGAASARSRRGSVPAAVEDPNVKLVREAADKLDALMLIMFEDINVHCSDLSSDLARATRRGLLDSFAVAVLQTNRSKFVQFLAFFCASLGGSFATELLDMLLRKLGDPNEASLTRQCAAHYVGSFVSRARFVTPALRHTALVSLAAFAQNYVNNVSPSALRPSALIHAVFYGCVQAILYGVCFAYDDYSIAVAQAASIALGLDDGRRGDGASSEEGAHWPLEEFQLERILSHETLPLKFCSGNVADEFARLAPSLGLPFVPMLLRRHRAIVLPIEAQWSDSSPQQFFPFDPYMLRLSSSFVDREETYAHFTMPTVIETNAIAAFAPHHAAAFAAASAALAAEAADELDTDDTTDDATPSSAHHDRVFQLQARRQRRRSRSPHSSLSGSSVGTPTREMLFGMGHSGSFSHQAHVVSSSFERLSFQ